MATVWKSLNPFWGEEITLLLPRGFHYLTIYVLDEVTTGGRVAGPQQCPAVSPHRQDDVIDKVSLSHQQISAELRGEGGTWRWGRTARPILAPGVPTLSPLAGADSWLSLAPVNPAQEVQGKIYLELRVPSGATRRRDGSIPTREWRRKGSPGNEGMISPASPGTRWLPHVPRRAGTKGGRGAAGTMMLGTKPLPTVPLLSAVSSQGLAPRDSSGTSDPFGRVSCCRHTLETAVSQCSVLGVAPGPKGGSGTLRHLVLSATSPCAQQVIKKTQFPHWDEVLEVELPEEELGEAVLSWDWDIAGKNNFLGRVEFSLDTLCQPHQGWFQLLPFPSTTKHHGLLEDTVLPPHHYQPLISSSQPILCLAQAASPKGPALAVLEEVTLGESQQHVPTKLVKILGQGLSVPLLGYLTTCKLARTTDPNTLFCSNSLSTKSTEQFMKVVGLQEVLKLVGLQEVLKLVVNHIFEEKYVELDPSKMELSQGRWAQVDIWEGHRAPGMSLCPLQEGATYCC
ncbi:RasGAP-activating-like protein 1 [Lamprotornis superbus]|uniref:RasGAP-activating-like protein 1 n=1 Tax=Lamprotornis superbus TaxID=245042 RepID=A0A835P028_9PASS|nr:RasGAP-activating-like protein 1 [Lamprotornis superbus]